MQLGIAIASLQAKKNFYRLSGTQFLNWHFLEIGSYMTRDTFVPIFLANTFNIVPWLIYNCLYLSHSAPESETACTVFIFFDQVWLTRTGYGGNMARLDSVGLVPNIPCLSHLSHGCGFSPLYLQISCYATGNTSWISSKFQYYRIYYIKSDVRHRIITQLQQSRKYRYLYLQACQFRLNHLKNMWSLGSVQKLLFIHVVGS